MRIDRFEKLLQHMKEGNLGHEFFTMEFWNYGTHTNPTIPGIGRCGCFVGELPVVFPEDWHFVENPRSGNFFPVLSYVIELYDNEHFGANVDVIECIEEFFETPIEIFANIFLYDHNSKLWGREKATKELEEFIMQHKSVA